MKRLTGKKAWSNCAVRGPTPVRVGFPTLSNRPPLQFHPMTWETIISNYILRTFMRRRTLDYFTLDNLYCKWKIAKSRR
ncbi:unnamed protein product [Leptosia nina]|uniref:Uncharacterized protein n=1 Tax=Leptosia nina TaxID=320188 RepID=A0AAV1J4H0_9NEOP